MLFVVFNLNIWVTLFSFLLLVGHIIGEEPLHFNSSCFTLQKMSKCPTLKTKLHRELCGFIPARCCSCVCARCYKGYIFCWVLFWGEYKQSMVQPKVYKEAESNNFKPDSKQTNLILRRLSIMYAYLLDLISTYLTTTNTVQMFVLYKHRGYLVSYWEQKSNSGCC